jgi:2,5-diamino-6-(ribosylamino)-4(3H)-pyrimidinone 5'-phosphate reductase
VILSNAVSPNGSLTGFPVDYGVYYPLMLSYKPDAVLVGADTVLAAPVKIPLEQESDRLRRPSEQGETRPWWVIVDSRGRLPSILHFFRRMEYVREIIVARIRKDTAGIYPVPGGSGLSLPGCREREG